MRIAAGFAVHTGWAEAVLVAGDLRRPLVLDRRRVRLVPEDLPGAVYHAAQGLPVAEAERLVEKVHAAVEATVPAVLGHIVDVARRDGELVAVGLSGGPPRDVPELSKVLSAHNLLHLAEGELYRGVLWDAAADRGLPVAPLSTKHWAEDAALALGATADLVATRLAELRVDLGAPWRVDHKVATAAALTALAAAGPA
jgi:hypothetical protein